MFELFEFGGDLIDTFPALLIGLDRPRIDPAIVCHGGIVVLDDRVGPGKADLCPRLFGGGGEFLQQDCFDQRGILEHRVFVQEIGRDGAAARLVVLPHEGPDIVADLHAAGLQCVADGMGLDIVVLPGKRLEDLALHLLARVIGEGFHRIEGDRLRARRGTDVGMDEPVAQTAFHGRDRGAEGLGDGLRRLPVDLHHPGEGLELVDRVHRRLGDVFGERERGGHIAIIRDQAAVDLRAVGEALGTLVRDELDERRMAPATGEHPELAIDLLDEQRLQEAQNSDAGLQICDVLRGIGLGGIGPHIRGMGDEVADGDGGRFERLSHDMSFSTCLRGPRESSRDRSPDPGTDRTKGPLSLSEGQRACR